MGWAEIGMLRMPLLRSDGIEYECEGMGWMQESGRVRRRKRYTVCGESLEMWGMGQNAGEL